MITRTGYGPETLLGGRQASRISLLPLQLFFPFTTLVSETTVLNLIPWVPGNSVRQKWNDTCTITQTASRPFTDTMLSCHVRPPDCTPLQKKGAVSDEVGVSTLPPRFPHRVQHSDGINRPRPKLAPNSTTRKKKNSQEGKAHPTFQPMTKLYIISYQVYD